MSLAAAILPTVSYATGFGDPLPGLTAEQQAAFQSGKTAFVTVEAAGEGLGPIFNENSCAACHVGPAGTAATGAIGGTTERLETRFGKSVYGAFDPLANKGGSLLQDHAIGAAAQYLVNPTPFCLTFVFTPEQVPADANVVARRRTTPLFGLGLVDAVPDDALVALAAFEGIFYPLTAGRPSHLVNADNGEPAIGRFGWKAQVPTLHVFSGDAYLNEMGVTNPSFMAESCPPGGLLHRGWSPALLQSCSRAQRRRRRCGSLHRLHAAPCAASPRGRGAPADRRRDHLRCDRMRPMPHQDHDHRPEPDRGAGPRRLPPLFGLPAARHGQPGRRHRAERGDGANDAHAARRGGCARRRAFFTTGVP